MTKIVKFPKQTRPFTHCATHPLHGRDNLVQFKAKDKRAEQIRRIRVECAIMKMREQMMAELEKELAEIYKKDS